MNFIRPQLNTHWSFASRRTTGRSPGSRRAAWEATAASNPADSGWPAPWKFYVHFRVDNISHLCLDAESPIVGHYQAGYPALPLEVGVSLVPRMRETMSLGQKGSTHAS